MKKTIAGVNDLLTCNPELAKEYDIEKNIEPIENILSHSHQKVWWRCLICGYSWEQRVDQRNWLKIDGTYQSHRHQKNSSCPKCSKFRKTSFSEQAIFFYIKKYFKDATNSYRNKKVLGKFELDIYIPSLKVAIEYDGFAWHKNISKDLNKSFLCKKNSIKLIRIREIGCPSIEDASIKIMVDANILSTLEDAIKKILLILNINNAIIDINTDIQKIQRQYKKRIVEHSVASDKKLLKEFSSDNLISPECVALNSNYEYLWICENGHKYKMSPNRRSNNGCNCPICSNHRVLKGYNDLATTHPKIVKEWNYEKNGNLKPTQVTYGSEKKVWWKCVKCGNEWKALIYSRTAGTGCPKCGRKRATESKLKKYRKVVQYNKNGNFIKIFNSIKEASELCGIPKSSISSCCTRRIKTCHGYIFRYAEKN